MNKFSVAIVLALATFVAVASANKGGHEIIDEDDDHDFELGAHASGEVGIHGHEHDHHHLGRHHGLHHGRRPYLHGHGKKHALRGGHRGRFHHRPIHHGDDFDHFDDFDHHNHGGFGHGGHHGRLGRHRRPLRGPRVVGGGLGGGAIGGRGRLHSHNAIEGEEGGLIGGEKHLGGHIGHSDFNEIEGGHKHQVLKKDKTIIHDKGAIINDVDGFKVGSGHSDEAGFNAGKKGVVAQHAGGRIENDKDIEAEGGAIGGAGGAGGVF